MGGFDKFCFSILDALANGPFFNEEILWEKTGYKKFDIETKINDINKRKINVNNDTELKIILLKSLALLTMFPHNYDSEIKNYTKLEKKELKEILDKLYGKIVVTDDFFNILNL